MSHASSLRPMSLRGSVRHRAIRARCGRRARDPIAARRGRCAVACARPFRAHGRMGRSIAARTPHPAGGLDHGLPRLGPRRQASQARRDDALLREMERRPIRANAITAGRPMSISSSPISNACSAGDESCNAPRCRALETVAPQYQYAVCAGLPARQSIFATRLNEA